MNESLPAQRQAAQHVRVGIARKQQRLIDQHRAVPDVRRPSQPGQGHARDHGLDKEQEETAHQHGRDEQPACSWAISTAIQLGDHP